MGKSNAASRIAILLLTCVLFPSFTAAQSSSGNILGVVTDQTGSIVPGAKIIVTDQSTNIQQTLITDSSGRFQALLLPVGTYTVTASASGMKEGELKGIVLETQQSREVNFVLVPATVQQTVTVEATAVQVERSDATVGQVIHSQQVSQLPLNGRDFVQLAALAPGVTQGETGFFTNQGQGEVAIRGSVSLSVAGERENDNDWLLDGVDNNELSAGAVSILPSIDAIQEFKVLAFNYSAEYGSRGGTTVLVTTKSGTNQFHGSGFEFLRNSELDARNYFDPPQKPVFVQNQFGATFGGPIIKDKTFFFLSYQGERVHQGLTVLSTVPTALQRQGIFTESFPGFEAPTIYDPASTATNPATGVLSRTPFPNNAIPQNRLDPIGLALVNLFPLPNVPGTLSNDYLSNPVKTFSDDAGIVRIDHNFSAKDTLFGRFAIDDAVEYFPGGLPGFASGGPPAVSVYNTNFSTGARNLGLSETHVFSSNNINQVSVGYNRDFNRFLDFGYGSNESAVLGIPGANNPANPDTSELSEFNLINFDSLGSRPFTPFQGGTNIFHYQDTVTHVVRAHTMTFGFAARVMQLNTLGNNSFNGTFNFDNNFTAQTTANGGFDASTGLDLASLLLGLPASSLKSIQFAGDIIGRRWKEYRGFFEDDWKVTPSLTLNLGFAYGVTTPMSEAHNRQSNFDPSTGTFLVPGVNAGPNVGVLTDYHDFAPRIGLAWSPAHSTKTVVRAGYGIFYDVGVVGGAQGLYQNPPDDDEIQYTSDDLNTAVKMDNGFPIVTSPPPLSSFNGNVTEQQLDTKQGRIQQWNLNVQREFPGAVVVTATYAGTRGEHIEDKGLDTNTATPGPGVDPPSRRPFPQFGLFDSMLSIGTLRYDAFLLRGEKQANHGLYFLASYTYSKAFTNGLSQGLATPQLLTGAIYYPLNVFPNEDKGLSALDLTQELSLSIIYNLPFGKGRTWLATGNGIVKGIASDWQTGLIEHLRTGFPLFPLVAQNEAGTDTFNRPIITCNPTLSRNRETVNEFFNTSCFAAPPSGVLSITPRSEGFGPRQANTDFSVIRTFPLSKIREGIDLQFRAEFFNIFNTAQFDQPDSSYGDPGFGKISDTINSSRQIQFAVKINF